MVTTEGIVERPMDFDTIVMLLTAVMSHNHNLGTHSRQSSLEGRWLCWAWPTLLTKLAETGTSLTPLNQGMRI